MLLSTKTAVWKGPGLQEASGPVEDRNMWTHLQRAAGCVIVIKEVKTESHPQKGTMLYKASRRDGGI